MDFIDVRKLQNEEIHKEVKKMLEECGKTDTPISVYIIEKNKQERQNEIKEKIKKQQENLERFKNLPKTEIKQFSCLHFSGEKYISFEDELEKFNLVKE